jgi:tetratricopeptide (TPR) repeat protein
MLQRENNYLSEARTSFEQALETWSDLDAEGDVASALLNLGWVEVLDARYEAAQRYFEQAEEMFGRLKLRGQLPSLREKQGKLLIKQAIDATDEKIRLAQLAQAETYLQEGREIGRQYEKNLYVALCLAALCRVAEMKGEFDRIVEWEAELRAYAEDDYLFGPAFADLERVLGDVAMRQAKVDKPDLDMEKLDKAAAHYLSMFLHLVRHSPHLYRQQREFLREWLPRLPSELRQRVANRLIEGWLEQPGDLGEKHPGFIRTIERMSDL